MPRRKYDGAADSTASSAADRHRDRDRDGDRHRDVDVDGDRNRSGRRGCASRAGRRTFG
jgi:hypothetical protein